MINLQPADFISKHKNNILNIAIIILALIIANKIYKAQMKTIESLRQQKDTEIKKNEALREIIQLEKNINYYKKSLVKKDVSLLINNISNLAKQSNIKIVSIKPDREKDYSSYMKQAFSLQVIADNYHIIAKFISKLENYSDIYIIDSMNLRPFMETQEKSTTLKLSADLKISTILWKE